jgi:cytochrome o ubiquinol oxidase subunit 3
MNSIASTQVMTHGSSKTMLGFWIYLMTDCMLFASLFATYAVLHGGTFGNVTSRDIFDMPFVLTETILLLTSSFTCGLAVLAARSRNRRQVVTWFSITFALGAAFLAMELYEFTKLASEGYGWQASAFLSAFFTLVATHGLHITAGLIWIATLMVYVLKKGLNDHAVRKLTLLGMFWHFLDVVWIFIFTMVYLMGVI